MLGHGQTSLTENYLDISDKDGGLCYTDWWNVTQIDGILGYSIIAWLLTSYSYLFKRTNK